MKLTPQVELPKDFDWREWVQRWERMQERYLVRRRERFDVMVRLVGDALEDGARRIVDLACGPGSLTQLFLDAFPQAEVIGLDFDPVLLSLAEKRLEPYGSRARLVQWDLRKEGWAGLLPSGADAMVSATALHWLDPNHLADLYGRIGGALRPGGMFLNADHVASGSEALQKAWESHREEMRRAEGMAGRSDDWLGFWKGLGGALELDTLEIAREAAGGAFDKGVEPGMPLDWHFARLIEAGFTAVDCFWRCDCDAIYGAVKSDGKAG